MSYSRVVSSILAASAALMPFVDPLTARATGFETANPNPRQNAILSGVLTVTRQLRLQGKKPVSIFDLDATLFEAGSRHKAIMLEFATKNSHRYPKLRKAIASWVPDELPYEVSGLFPSLGISSPEEQKHAKKFWSERFFSNDYLHHDTPIAGAVRYISALAKAGGHIVYLTGRNDKLMRPGSITTLEAAGFPVDPERALLIMSPVRGIRDSKFKGSPEVHDQIASIGPVVAIFDNEPGNCNELQRSFPEALTVFLDTNHSPGAPAVDPGVPWIRNFRWSWLDR